MSLRPRTFQALPVGREGFTPSIKKKGTFFKKEIKISNQLIFNQLPPPGQGVGGRA